MLVRFKEVLGELGAARRPLLLTGTRECFSAGFDIKQPASEVARAGEISRGVLADLRSYPAPVVAAVEGAAVGLGLLIATSADLLVASRSAVLRMPEVLLGIDSETGPLERFLPGAWIRRMCLLGAGYTPEEMNLTAAGVSVCDPGSTLAVAKTVIEQLAEIDHDHLRRAKQRLDAAKGPRPAGL